MAEIIIVDDERTNRRILRAHLEREDHRVLEAESEGETVALLENRAAPDLLIVDLHLKEASGVELLRHLRADPIFGPLPALFFSAVPEREAVLMAAGLGIIEFLAKPLNTARLRHGVGTAVARNWMQNLFEDPVAVCRRLSTDREVYRDRASRLFASLSKAIGPPPESAAKEPAAPSPERLARDAAELGLSILQPALEQWQRDGAGAAAPPLLRRGATIARLCHAFASRA